MTRNDLCRWNTKRCCGRTALVRISNRFIADSQTEYRMRKVKSYRVVQVVVVIVVAKNDMHFIYQEHNFWISFMCNINRYHKDGVTFT